MFIILNRYCHIMYLNPIKYLDMVMQSYNNMSSSPSKHCYVIVKLCVLTSVTWCIQKIWSLICLNCVYIFSYPGGFHCYFMSCDSKVQILNHKDLFKRIIEHHDDAWYWISSFIVQQPSGSKRNSSNIIFINFNAQWLA